REILDRDFDPTRPVPRILIVTTFNLDEYVFNALRAGASGFLLKDATPPQLVDAVRTVARGDALVDPAVTRTLIGAYADRLRPRPESGDSAELLTPREREVLRLLAQGMSNVEIAAALVVTRETAKTYVSRILLKLGVRDRVQAVVYAYRSGIADE
ncbi:MAG TPA: response regulator transcription factor, partial [Galbitalea sp.]